MNRIGGHSTVSRELVLLFILSVPLRFVALDRHPLWIDEANSVLIAWEGAAGILDALAEDGNPPLYYGLLHWWMKVFGSSESAVRALSAFFGVTSVGAVYWAARELLPGRRSVPLVAASIVALGPLHVALSRMCRMYTLTPLLALLALVALVRAFRRQGPAWLVLHAALLAAGLYTHNYFLFLLPLGPVLALSTRWPAGRWRSFISATSASLLAVCLYAPWIPVVIRQTGSGVSAWIRPIWEATPPSLALLRSLEVMGVGASFPGHMGPLSRLAEVLSSELLWGGVRLLGALLAFLLIGLGSLWRQERGPGRTAVPVLLLLLALPLALPWLASLTLQPVYLVGRYEMVAYAAFAILAANGLDALATRSRAVGVAVGGAWIALSLLALGAFYATPVRDSEKRSAEWVAETAQPGDVFLFPGYARAVPEYYLRRVEFAGERVSFPASVGRHMGWFDAERAVREPGRIRREARQLAAELGDRSAEPPAQSASAPYSGRVILLNVDPVSRRAGVTGTLREALRAAFGGEAAIPSSRVGQPPPVYIYSR